MRALDRVETRTLRTLYGEADEILYRYQDSDVILVGFGAWRSAKPLSFRIHSSCLSAHYLASVECDCREQLQITMEEMQSEGAGVVIHMDQDGRANGHAAIMRSAKYATEHGCGAGTAYEALGYPADARQYEVVGQILQDLEISSVAIYSNNPAKIAAVEASGITVVPRSVVAIGQPHLTSYYDKKRDEGHRIPDLAGTGE